MPEDDDGDGPKDIGGPCGSCDAEPHFVVPPSLSLRGRGMSELLDADGAELGLGLYGCES